MEMSLERALRSSGGGDGGGLLGRAVADNVSVYSCPRTGRFKCKKIGKEAQ